MATVSSADEEGHRRRGGQGQGRGQGRELQGEEGQRRRQTPAPLVVTTINVVTLGFLLREQMMVRNSYRSQSSSFLSPQPLPGGHEIPIQSC